MISFNAYFKKPLISLLFSFSVSVSPSLADELETLRNQFDRYVSLTVPMDFGNFWYAMEPVGKEASDKLKIYLSRLKRYEAQGSQCRRDLLADMKYITQLALDRIELTNKVAQNKGHYSGQFAALGHGKDWYLHWLKSWLMSDISTDDLKAIAYNELRDAEIKRSRINALGLAENNKEFSGNDHAAILAAFKKRDRIVRQNLQEVIVKNFVPEQIKIVKSNLPKSFPAPGFYNGAMKQFTYHLSSDTLPEKHMDWLYLHEANPGHHYQFSYFEEHPTCDLPSVVQSTVFAEGWGAYVETLGRELGLYTDSSSFEYALDWQEMRAVRVLLDIGIHFEGWSDEQARSVWMHYIPSQQDIMDREIARIHNWPVQVITYVYGKAMILREIENLKQSNPEYQFADIHTVVLGKLR
ncbi:DUF885 family protein [Kordiimonas sp. SCSIO 12610]|uniref:DUF885 family protein n=1 Tax=Kordiimonas sp. SCSIO 12610 TaxID=2829597 RepID=UPI00210D9D0D|nr:DUF885 family protein [Kordiimonas sp. SCSIO 12610]UTW54660.1 DUF885 family protein [Kordiimonas sp. SCSIO 12610]